MKAATGELQLTVITVIAIALIAGVFYGLWPSIKNTITTQWNKSNCVEFNNNGTCKRYGN